MDAILAIAAGFITILVAVVKYSLDKERKKRKEKEAFDEALATNDFSYLSDDLDDKFHRMRKKNLQRGSK